MNPEMPMCFPAELVASTGFLLGRLGMAVKAATMEEFERAGCSAYHYAILALLEEGARTAQAAIADALRYDPSQLVAHLDALEDGGFIERRRDPSDRRRQMVSLTPAGRKQLALFRRIVKRVESEFLAPLDDDDRAALHELLLKIATNRDQRFRVAAARV